MKKRNRCLCMLIYLALLMSAAPVDPGALAGASAEAASVGEMEAIPAPEEPQPDAEASEAAAEAEAPEEALEPAPEASEPTAGEAPEPDAAAQPEGEAGDGSLEVDEPGAEAPAAASDADANLTPAFAPGYAELVRDGVPVYPRARGENEPKAILGRGVVYVTGRDEASGRLELAYYADPERGVDVGWADAENLRPMEPEEEIPAFLAFCANLRDVAFYRDSPELPLPRISCEAPEEDAPAEHPEDGAQKEREKREAEPGETEHPVVLEGAIEEGNPEISTMPLPTQVPLFRMDDVLPILEAETLTLGEGMTVELPGAAPEGEEYDYDAEIVEIGPEGTLTGLRAGATRISAAGSDAIVEVTVLPAPEAGQLSFEEAPRKIFAGEDVRLRAACAPAAMAELAYRFEGEAPEGVTLSEDGALSADASVQPGATFAVAAYDVNHPEVSISTQVTVAAATSIQSLDPGEVRLGVGESFRIDDGAEGIIRLRQPVPSGAAGSYTFRSSDSSVAKVDEDGLVTAEGVGAATIRVTSDFDGSWEALTVTVLRAPEELRLSQEALRLGVGMRAAIAPQFPGGTYSICDYSSSEGDIAAVDAWGSVIARAPGEATITVRCGSGLTADCRVEVVPGTRQIHLAAEEITVGVGEAGARIVATPDEGTLAEFRYEIAPEDAAKLSVDADGALCARAAGAGQSVQVVVRDANRPQEVPPASVTVTIAASPTKRSQMKLARASMKMGTGDSYQIEAYVRDENGCERGLIQLEEGLSASYTYKSSKPGVVSVNDAGELVAKKAGTAVIRIATAQNAKVYRDLTVKVSKYTSSLSLPEAMTLGAEMRSSLQPVFSSGASAVVEFTSGEPALLAVNRDTGALTAGSSEAISEPRQVAVTATLPKTGQMAVCQVTLLPAPQAGGVKFDLSGLNCAEQDEQGKLLRIGKKEAGVKLAPVCAEEDAMCDFLYAVSGGTVGGLKVGDAGALTAKTAGDYLVRATASNNPDAYAEIRVKVVAAPTSVNFHPSNSAVLKLGVGDTYQIAEYAADPETGVESGILQLKPATSSASYTYRSNKASIAKVSKAGLITAKAKGSALIRVKTQNGKYRDLKVKVIKVATDVALSPAMQQVGELSGGKLTVSYPSGGSSAVEKFESANPELLQIRADGGFTTGRLPEGASAQDVDVTVTTRSGLTATATVRVLPHPEELRFDRSEYVISVGMTGQTAVRFPDGTLAQKLRYRSGAEDVATINEAGEITGLREGTAQITVTANPGAEGCEVTSAPATVRVVAAPVRAAYGDDLPEQINLLLNDAVTIPEPTAYDAEGAAVPANFSYKSSNSSYVKVSGNTMTAVKTGAAVTITATVANNPSAEKASFRVRVFSAKADRVTLRCDGREVNGKSLNMYVNDAHPTDVLKLTGEISGTKVNYGSLSFASSEEAVATVDADGTVTAWKAGTAVITATAKGGASAKCTVEVGTLCTSATVDTEPLTLEIGDLRPLAVTFEPSGTAMRLRCESGDPTVATVSEAGAIRAVGGGRTRVTVRGQGGELLGEIDVRVLYDPDSATLPVRKLFMRPGEAVVLAPKLGGGEAPAPEDVNVYLEASSQVPAVAKLQVETAADQSAGTPASYRVTAGIAGSSRVTFRTHGGIEASCEIVVSEAAGGDLSRFAVEEGERYVIYRGDSAELECDLSAAAFNGEVNLRVESSDEGKLIASQENGAWKIAAQAAGTVTLHLMVDGEVADSLDIEVLTVAAPWLTFGQNLAEHVEDAVTLDADLGDANSTNCTILIDPLPLREEGLHLLGKYEVTIDDPSLLTFDRAANQLCSTVSTGVTNVTVETGGGSVSVQVTVAPAPVYRALLISEYNGEGGSSALPFAQTNINNVKGALGASRVRGHRYAITVSKNPTKASIQNAITNTFKKVKENDVSVIYIVAHGHMGSGSASDQYAFSRKGFSLKNASTYVRDEELMKWIKASNAVKGKVVLILDSCHSGGFINHQRKVGGLKADGNIAVLAAQAQAYGGGFFVRRNSSEKTFEFFTRALCLGFGRDQDGSWGACAADVGGNGDQLVSLQEAFDYASNKTQNYARKYREMFTGNGTGFVAPGFNTKKKAQTFTQVPKSFIPNGMEDLMLFGVAE